MGWHTWHIIGNSPSILEEDLSALRNTIGVNRILRHKTFVPDYVLLVDDSVYRREKERLQAFGGKILCFKGLRQIRGLGRRDIELFDLEDAYYPIRKFEGPLERSMNAGVYAIEWASRKIHPGRGQIVLHGMDFRVKKTKRTHFWGNGKREECDDLRWSEVLRTLRVSVEFLWANRIRVLNASPWSGPLDNVVPRVRHE